METTSSTSNFQLARRSSRARGDHVVKRLYRAVAAVAALVALTSCLGSSNNSATTHLRGVNLVTDAPSLEFTVDGVDVSAATYGDLTPLTPAHPGSHLLGVSGIIPSDLITQPQIEYTPFGTPESQTLVDGSDYTLIAYGTVADPKILVASDSDLSNGVPDNTASNKVL